MIHKWVFAGVLIGVCSGANAAVVLSDNFEIYGSQTAFDNVWVPSTTGQGATYSTTQSYSTSHAVSAGTGAQRSERNIGETTHSAANPITFSFRFYDSGGGAYREYADLVDGAGTGNGQMIEMGLNNNLVSSNYMARVVGLDGGAGASAFFKLDGTGVPTRTTGWHELKAILTPSGASFYVDDTFSKTVDWSADTAARARSYDKVRLGSNLTSTAVAYFDDVSVLTDAVPEPTALASAAVFGGIAVLGRRRRRRA